MTVPSTSRKAGPFFGDGVQTSFPFTFKIFAPGDVAVTTANARGVETELVLDADYSVTLNPNQETSPGGFVTYPLSGSPLPTGSKLSITGDLDYDQPLDLPSGGNFSPLALENQLDRTTMQIQQLREEMDRTLRAPVTANVSATLPSPDSNALIGWNSSETGLQNFPLSQIATALAFATYRHQSFTGDGVTDTFPLAVDPVTLGNTDVSLDGLVLTPGVDYQLAAGNIVTTVPPDVGAKLLVRYGEALPTAAVAAIDTAFPGYQWVSSTNVEGALKEIVDDLADTTNPANGAGLVAFDWAAVYSSGVGKGVKEAAGAVNIFRYIPPAEWAAITNFTSTYDCQGAFETALANHSHLYCPPGLFRISVGLDLANLKRIYGSGERTTVIECTNTSATRPIIYLGGESALMDIGIRFASGIVTGSETMGQRVGVQLYSPTSTYACQRQGGLRNVLISNVGTGVYDPVISDAFSCVFDSVEIVNFSYRGWDMRSPNRTGNVYRNLYIHNINPPFTNVDCGFALEGEESESTIEQLNVENGTMNNAIRFFNVRALSATSIHIEQVRLRDNNSALINWDRSAGWIGAITVYYCAIATTGWSIFKIFDSIYGGAVANQNTCNDLHIGTLHCKGLNDAGVAPFNVGIGSLVDFYFIVRPAASVGSFFMQIDRWVWNTFKGDSAVYQAFPADPQNQIQFVATISGPPVGRVFAQNGWVRRADGMIEQWGRVNVNANSTAIINLPVPFPVACRVQLANPFDTGTSANYRLNANPVSNSQISITNTSAGTVTACWWALGH